MSRNRQALCILGFAVLLASAYGFLARAGFWHAELAEANIEANLIRLQTFLFERRPHAVLVGSSITGRLLPSYFSGTSLAPMANLGLDGSGTLFALELVRTNPVPVVILEENTFLRPPNSNDQMLARKLSEFSFRLSKYFPLLRAQARPSSILYTCLKLRGKGGSGAAPVESPPPVVPGSAALPLPGEDAAFETVHNQLRKGIKQLLDDGCRVVVLRLPSGHSLTSASDLDAVLGETLAREFNLLRVDLGQECASRGESVTFTDGIHLSAGSARQASRLLAEVLASRSSSLAQGASGAR